jgi:hypothetical protein
LDQDAACCWIACEYVAVGTVSVQCMKDSPTQTWPELNRKPQTLLSSAYAPLPQSKE